MRTLLLLFTAILVTNTFALPSKNMNSLGTVWKSTQNSAPKHSNKNLAVVYGGQDIDPADSFTKLA